MNIPRRFINQVFPPQKVEAAPESAASRKKRASGYSNRRNCSGPWRWAALSGKTA